MVQAKSIHSPHTYHHLPLFLAPRNGLVRLTAATGAELAAAVAEAADGGLSSSSSPRRRFATVSNDPALDVPASAFAAAPACWTLAYESDVVTLPSSMSFQLDSSATLLPHSPHRSSCARMTSALSLKCVLISFSTACQQGTACDNLHGNGGLARLLPMASSMTMRRTLAEYCLLAVVCRISWKKRVLTHPRLVGPSWFVQVRLLAQNQTLDRDEDLEERRLARHPTRT